MQQCVYMRVYVCGCAYVCVCVCVFYAYAQRVSLRVHFCVEVRVSAYNYEIKPQACVFVCVHISVYG